MPIRRFKGSIDYGQYANGISNSGAPVEYAYDDYVTSEFMKQYDPNKRLIGTDIDRYIREKINELNGCSFNLYRIKVGDTIACAAIVLDGSSYIYLDGFRIYQEIGDLPEDVMLPSTLNGIYVIV